MKGDRVYNKRFIIRNILGKGKNYRTFVVYDINDPDKGYLMREIVAASDRPADINAAVHIFERETEKLRRLDNKSVFRFIDGFIEKDRFYLVTSLTEGINLVQMSGPKSGMTNREIIYYIRQITEVFRYLSTLPVNQLPHLETDPFNFFISKDKVVLGDMGTHMLFMSSRVQDHDEGMDPDPGKPSSPAEQDNIWRAAVVIYFFITGKFPDDDPKKIVPPVKINPGISESVSKIVMDTLTRSSNRILSVEELKHKLDRIYGKILEDSLRQSINKSRKTHFRAGVKNFSLKALITILLLGSLIYLARNQFSRYSLDRCETNCENIARALKRYAEDHEGKYPQTLQELVPKYTGMIPICPAAFRNTYSKTYKSYDIHGYHYCRFYCEGHYHGQAGGGKNLPEYNSYDGVISSKTGENLGSNPVNYLLEAYIMDSQGEHEKALALLSNLTLIDGATLEKRSGIKKYLVFWNMARILEKMDKRKEALEKMEITAGLLLSKDHPAFNGEEIELFLSDYSRMGSEEQALDFLNRYSRFLVGISPLANVRTLDQLEDLYIKAGRPDMAVLFLSDSIHRLPSSERKYVQGEIQRLKGNNQEARRLFREYVNQKGSLLMFKKARKRIDE